MSKQAFDKEKIVLILVEAFLEGDGKIAEKYGITTRTIRNYRKKLETDNELSQIFLKKKTEVEKDWMHSIAPAIRSSIKFLETASREADPKDAQVISSVTSALKVLSEVQMTSELIDVRISQQNRQNNQPNRQVATSTTSNPSRMHN